MILKFILSAGDNVMIQHDVLAISIVLMGLLAALFGWVAVGASDELANYGAVIASVYRLRTWLFGLAAVVLIAVNFQTLRTLPYMSTITTPAGAAIQHADAVAAQWQWAITPSTFKVGQTADFYVTSKDVNHGFALYDPDMRIVGETQAMPGYTNVLRYTFVSPGTYRVLCLEYCGVAHHVMAADITVTP